MIVSPFFVEAKLNPNTTNLKRL